MDPRQDTDTGTDKGTEMPLGIWSTGNYAPVQREIEATGLLIDGALPPDLSGTLFRNGPNPRYPTPATHWFGGDGMIHAISLANGRATYRNRWVRTPRWIDEDRAGRALFRTFAGKVPDAPEWAGTDSGVANTNIVWHANRLLALEEGHRPTQLSAATLETFGYAEYGAQQGPFTAHPKIDPHTGEMFFFGYNADGRFTRGISVGTIDADGRLARYMKFEAPYCSMVHDFMMTSRHLLFPILPLTGSRERAEQRLPAYAFEPERPAMIGVMARDAASPVLRWYEGLPCYVFHVLNAWEADNAIIADVMAYEEAPLFPLPDGGKTDPAKSRARLCRWTFDLDANTDQFSRVYLDDVTGEFPRVDERRAGLATAHGWYACANPDLAASTALHGIVHVDGQGARKAQYMLPKGDSISEPVFVERGADAPEGCGWLLAVVWRARENRSDLAVFNAQDVGSGPVALVKLGHRVPDGFHGNWVGAA